MERAGIYSVFDQEFYDEKKLWGTLQVSVHRIIYSTINYQYQNNA